MQDLSNIIESLKEQYGQFAAALDALETKQAEFNQQIETEREEIISAAVPVTKALAAFDVHLGSFDFAESITAANNKVRRSAKSATPDANASGRRSMSEEAKGRIRDGLRRAREAKLKGNAALEPPTCEQVVPESLESIPAAASVTAGSAHPSTAKTGGTRKGLR